MKSFLGDKRRLWLIIPLILLALVPLGGSSYLDFLLAMAMVYAIWCLGYNFLLGYTGLLSFGHGAYFGLGAYTVAMLTTKYGITSLPVVLVAAILVSTVMGALIGYICVRYTADYFALLTLAFSQLFYALIFKFYKWTGGDDGIHVTPPSIGGFELNPIHHPAAYYLFTFIVFTIMLLLGWRIASSPFGISLQAIRDSTVKAESLGIPVRRYKWYAFILSALFSGVAGALYAPLFGHVVPDLFSFLFCGEVLFATLLGGYTVYWGPVLGAFVFVVARSYITSFTIYWPFVLGILLIGVALFFPHGIAGAIRSLYMKRMGGGR